jgi:hypothetical protein
MSWSDPAREHAGVGDQAQCGAVRGAPVAVVVGGPLCHVRVVGVAELFKQPRSSSGENSITSITVSACLAIW